MNTILFLRNKLFNVNSNKKQKVSGNKDEERS